MAGPRWIPNRTAYDAGLLREYVAARYGSTLAYGGSSAVYFRGLRLARRLARLSGLSLDRVLSDLREDAEERLR